MERREYPRIKLPLVVELQHAALGKHSCVARDLAEGGIYVNLSDHGLQVGARVKLRRIITDAGDSQNPPQVDASVVRTDATGLALAFTTSTSNHLWNSISRSRDNLHIGSDFFQVYQQLLIEHADRGCLLVQQHGRWLLPGFYLATQTAQDVASYCAQQLGVEVQSLGQPVASRIDNHPLVPEATTLCLVLATTTLHQEVLLADNVYSDWRWLKRKEELAHLTFVDTWVRQVISQRLTG